MATNTHQQGAGDQFVCAVVLALLVTAGAGSLTVFLGVLRHLDLFSLTHADVHAPWNWVAGYWSAIGSFWGGK